MTERDVTDEVRGILADPTPAPEGEAVAWGCFDANGLDDKLVYRDQRRAEDAAFAFTPSMTVKALYASPVVSAGREEIARIIDPPVFGALDHYPPENRRVCRRAEAFSKADAILAALGTKGADHDWVKWDGGPSPAGDAEIEVRFKGWPEMLAKSPSILDWKHEGPPETHVIAYRLATDTGREG